MMFRWTLALIPMFANERNRMTKHFIPHLLVVLLAGATAHAQMSASEPPKRFNRVFSWGRLTDEDTARRFSRIGVTDIQVANNEQLALARKYGMIPYCGTFTPRGPHGQAMSSEEEKHFAYINGLDLKGRPSSEKNAEIDKRRLERKHRYGGEPVASLDTINSVRIPCFGSDVDYTLSRKSIDAICSRVDGVQGIFFDYIGYSNFKGCYCEQCLAAYKAYLTEKGLEDTAKHKNEFYRDRLVTYCNDMIGYVKSQHPDFKVVIHVYPTFLPEPLYGNRLKADFCGQTVAWYFPWDAVKIRQYTRVTVMEQDKYFTGARGVPFVGLNRRPGSLWVKDAATLDSELRTILASGGDTLMVCNGNDMIEPGIDKVFATYCGVGIDSQGQPSDNK
ncbi:MAG: hypothetical protein PHV28_08030 [Kiritimatiellae bacterium]|nr:hypothetical protein [Kiritimatiellia bacterium]